MMEEDRKVRAWGQAIGRGIIDYLRSYRSARRDLQPQMLSTIASWIESHRRSDPRSVDIAMRMAEAALDPDLYRAIDDLLVLRALAEGDE
jgi:hypothetical protein